MGTNLLKLSKKKTIGCFEYVQTVMLVNNLL